MDQIKSINKIEQVQRSFTRFITGMRPLSYDERLKSLHLYSVQRRFERYIIIYIWKILESIVPNLSQRTPHFDNSQTDQEPVKLSKVHLYKILAPYTE